MIDENIVKLMQAAGKKKILSETPAPVKTVEEVQLRENSTFLGEVVDSPMPTSIEMQILLEIRRTNRILRELRNAYLGIRMELNELDVQEMQNGK